MMRITKISVAVNKIMFILLTMNSIFLVWHNDHNRWTSFAIMTLSCTIPPVGLPKDWILVLESRNEQNVWFFVLMLKIKHF